MPLRVSAQVVINEILYHAPDDLDDLQYVELHNTGTAPKPSQVVRAADFSPKSYLESEVEVEAYLTSLRTKLLAVLHAGQRIRIQ